MREIKLVEITDEMKENQEKRKSLEKKAEDLCKKLIYQKKNNYFSLWVIYLLMIFPIILSE